MNLDPVIRQEATSPLRPTERIKIDEDDNDNENSDPAEEIRRLKVRRSQLAPTLD